MTNDAEQVGAQLRSDLNKTIVEKRTKEFESERERERLALIQEAGEGLDLALKLDAIQEAEQSQLGKTTPYKFKFHIENTDSDDDIGFEEGIIRTDTLSIRMAANPEDPKSGDELVMYFPVRDDSEFVGDEPPLYADTLTEFYVLKKVKHPDGDHDKYYFVWPGGISLSTHPSRKIKDQIADFNAFMDTATPDDFLSDDDNTQNVKQLRDDLLKMKLVWHKEAIF